MSGSLESLTVRTVVGERLDIWSIDADDTANVAAMKLIDHKIRTLGVLRDGELVGALGNNDLARKVVAPGRIPSEVKVYEIMSTELRTVTLDSTFLDCISLMDEHHVSHLIVLDDGGNYHGMLSWYELHKILIGKLKDQIVLLQDYAFGPGAAEQTQ